MVKIQLEKGNSRFKDERLQQVSEFQVTDVSQRLETKCHLPSGGEIQSQMRHAALPHLLMFCM